MSKITIFKEVVKSLAHRRGAEVIRPWQEFDMIAGTSTVGKHAHPFEPNSNSHRVVC